MKELKQDIHLPRLRQDLQLNPAPPEDGAPTWTLYDPAANKYYKIGWLEFECLARMGSCKMVSDLVKKVRAETTLDIDDDDAGALVTFLVVHNLVQADNAQLVNYITEQAAKRDKPWWQRATHGYLFFVIPLFKSQKFLAATFPYVSFLFTRAFFMPVLLLLCFGIYLSVPRLDELVTTFMSYLNAEGIFYLLLTTVAVKIAHEFSHAYMATKYGVPVTSMGIALIVLYPVLYSETTNAWKMMDRKKRSNIAMAGVMAELTLAAFALILWHVLPPGLGQSVCFMVAVVSLVASLIVNCNPLMKFDGYYLFSDMLGVDNLQDRSFQFAKWRLRRWLWGWDDPPPEQMPREMRNILTIFGFATWVYRFFLFIGIAVLVYYIFFKPLGFILMMVEILYFILFPILREIFVWWKERGRIVESVRGKSLLFLIVVGVFLSLVPAQGTVEVPAVLHARDYAHLYSPASARIEEIAVTQGMRVQEGQVLFRLYAPDIDYSISLSEQHVATLLMIKEREQAQRALVNKRPTLDADIESAREELKGHMEQKARLDVRAPFDGVVRDLDPYLHEGQWINSQTLLAVVVEPDSLSLSGYVSEQDMPRIKGNPQGWFYADYTPFSRLHVSVKKIEQADSPDIFWPALASVFGGPLPAERTRDGTGLRPLPRHPVYAAEFTLLGEDAGTRLPGFTATGTVVLDAEPVSAVSLLAQRLWSLVMRESGF